MPCMFRHSEWNAMPPKVQRLRNGDLRVVRNVTTMERDGETVYVGEVAVMTELAYAAYIGAQEVEAKREAAVIDDYTLALIEEGVL